VIGGIIIEKTQVKEIMKKLLLFILLLNNISFAQSSIFERLNAIDNKGLIFYDIDGYRITSENLKKPYNEVNLKTAYKLFSIKENETKSEDKNIGHQNVYVLRTEQLEDGSNQFNSYFFIENVDKNLVALSFSKVNKKDFELEKEISKLIVENKVPASIFSNPVIDSINFVNRKVKLYKSCYWTNVNTVQCPYAGEMNWSVHKEYADAVMAVESQATVTQAKKLMQNILSDEILDVEFEGTETKARKVIHKMKGGVKLVTGGKTLIIYYVAAKVRGNYVSCVMSHWDNDKILESGLPPLLDKFMKLK
jgi:hypothetical protein